MHSEMNKMAESALGPWFGYAPAADIGSLQQADIPRVLG
jgi:hypothetical protein